jgi:hypothetical protein
MPASTAQSSATSVPVDTVAPSSAAPKGRKGRKSSGSTDVKPKRKSAAKASDAAPAAGASAPQSSDAPSGTAKPKAPRRKLLFRPLPFKRYVIDLVNSSKASVTQPVRSEKSDNLKLRKTRLNGAAVERLQLEAERQVRELYNAAIPHRKSTTLHGNDIRRQLEVMNNSISKEALARLNNHTYDEEKKPKKKRVPTGAAAASIAAAASAAAGATTGVPAQIQTGGSAVKPPGVRSRNVEVSA